MALNLTEITGQESGIVVYGNRDAIICNWGSIGEGLPKLLGGMMLLPFPSDAEIVDHGVADSFSEFDSASWEYLYDANGDAPSLHASANRWPWWKLRVSGQDEEVLVIAPRGWN